MAQNMEHAEPLLGESGEPWTNPHSNVSKGATRAAVLGCLDGLVSNLCLILGVMAPCLAGRMAESRVLFTGAAGIFAGAFSMAVGEWLSVTAENEYLKGEIEAERAHIEDHRDEENEELESYFVEQGLRKETARSVVADLESHPDATSKLLSFHTRFHWGVEMDELGGSPTVAAVASFCAFAAGGIVPLLPWTVPCSLVDRSKLLPPGGCLYAKLAITIFLSLLTAFAVGVTLTWSTPSNSVRGGLRYAAAAMMAAGATYVIGYAVGSALD